MFKIVASFFFLSFLKKWRLSILLSRWVAHFYKVPCYTKITSQNSTPLHLSSATSVQSPPQLRHLYPVMLQPVSAQNSGFSKYYKIILISKRFKINFKTSVPKDLPKKLLCRIRRCLKLLPAKMHSKSFQANNIAGYYL